MTGAPVWACHCINANIQSACLDSIILIHVTLRQLEYFTAAVRHGGAARGAQALNVSQPSVSKAIADLEALWGERLFVRLHAQGLAPTPAGLVRYREASTLLQQAQALSGPARGSELAGTLNFGCLSTLGPRWVPAMLARFSAAHPQVRVQLHEGDTEVLTRQLERGGLDLALMYDLGLARGLQLEAVAQLWPHAVLPAGHRLARSATVGLAELAKEPLVLIKLPHSREYFLSLFRAAGVTPRIVAESPSLEMVRSMVGHGLGVSVLTTRPLRDVSDDGRRLVCRRLRGPLTPQAVVLATPAAHDGSGGLAQAFATVAREHFARQAGK